jgi:hypothetical protein
MSFLKSTIFLSAALVLMLGQGTFAHGTKQDSTDAHVVGITRGTQVHLTVRGTAASELHLHGYDAAFSGEPARAVFDAVHTGRFALKMHAEDELLGKRERAVLYLEVRER